MLLIHPLLVHALALFGAAASLLGASNKAAGGIALAVGVVGFIADARTKHIAHTLTTDVRFTETVVVAGRTSEVRIHQTSIVNAASKVNLRLEEALPAMLNETSRSLAGLLPPATR